MTDRELLELAAKAAGYVNAKWQNMEGWGELRHGMSSGIWTGDEYWNPLADDGDALRLLVALRMDVLFYPSDEVEVIATHHGVTAQLHPCAMEPAQADMAAATRRAIVRAAAAIGAAK